MVRQLVAINGLSLLVFLCFEEGGAEPVTGGKG
jgi:hypothetical protein